MSCKINVIIIIHQKIMSIKHMSFGKKMFIFFVLFVKIENIKYSLCIPRQQLGVEKCVCFDRSTHIVHIEVYLLQFYF